MSNNKGEPRPYPIVTDRSGPPRGLRPSQVTRQEIERQIDLRASREPQAVHTGSRPVSFPPTRSEAGNRPAVSNSSRHDGIQTANSASPVDQPFSSSTQDDRCATRDPRHGGRDEREQSSFPSISKLKQVVRDARGTLSSQDRHDRSPQDRTISRSTGRSTGDEPLNIEEVARREIARLNQEVTTLRAETRRLVNRLATEAESNASLRHQADQMQRSIDNNASFVGRQEQDDSVCGQFRQLLSHVRDWSAPFYDQVRVDSTSLGTSSAGQLRSILDIAPDTYELSLLQNKKTRRLMVRGWVMHCLIQDLLVHPFAWCGKEVASSLSPIYSALLEACNNETTTQPFQDWRALTAYLISSTSDPDSLTREMRNRSAILSDMIMAPFGALLSESRYKSAREGLVGLIHRARALSELVEKQRAIWTVKFPFSHDPARDNVRNQVFDDSSMVDRDGEDEDENAPMEHQRRIVSVFVTPCLYKRGNMNGDHYDQEYCVEKAEVQCRMAVSGP